VYYTLEWVRRQEQSLENGRDQVERCEYDTKRDLDRREEQERERAEQCCFQHGCIIPHGRGSVNGNLSFFSHPVQVFLGLFNVVTVFPQLSYEVGGKEVEVGEELFSGHFFHGAIIPHFGAITSLEADLFAILSPYAPRV
jgi:hypothetical protein